jgi:hypothetical protein
MKSNLKTILLFVGLQLILCSGWYGLFYSQHEVEWHDSHLVCGTVLGKTQAESSGKYSHLESYIFLRTSDWNTDIEVKTDHLTYFKNNTGDQICFDLIKNQYLKDPLLLWCMFYPVILIIAQFVLLVFIIEFLSRKTN